MREGAVALRHVESQDAQADRAHELLLERALLLVSDLICALSRQQVVLALVELFLDFTTEHLCSNNTLY